MKVIIPKLRFFADLCILHPCMKFYHWGHTTGIFQLRSASDQCFNFCKISAILLFLECRDLYADSRQCREWRSQGYCDRNPAWMWANCRDTCGICSDPPAGWFLRLFHHNDHHYFLTGHVHSHILVSSVNLEGVFPYVVSV